MIGSTSRVDRDYFFQLVSGSTSDIAMLAAQLNEDALYQVGTLSLQRHVAGSLPPIGGCVPARMLKHDNPCEKGSARGDMNLQVREVQRRWIGTLWLELPAATRLRTFSTRLITLKWILCSLSYV